MEKDFNSSWKVSQLNTLRKLHRAPKDCRAGLLADQKNNTSYIFFLLHFEIAMLSGCSDQTEIAAGMWMFQTQSKTGTDVPVGAGVGGHASRQAGPTCWNFSNKLL